MSSIHNPYRQWPALIGITGLAGTGKDTVRTILEDAGYIAGKCIPIVVVYGKRWFVDNIERCMGHVRLAKDAQRLKTLQSFLAKRKLQRQHQQEDQEVPASPQRLLVNDVIDQHGVRSGHGDL